MYLAFVRHFWNNFTKQQNFLKHFSVRPDINFVILITIITHKQVKQIFRAYLHFILLYCGQLKRFEIEPICHILMKADGRAKVDLISEERRSLLLKRINFLRFIFGFRAYKARCYSVTKAAVSSDPTQCIKKKRPCQNNSIKYWK